MQPAVSIITLGVRDLERALRFYRDGLGWPTDGIVGTEFEGGAVVFFHLNNGLILALWPQQELARDAHLPAVPSGGPTFSLAHNVRSKDEVDRILAQAQAAGAMIPDPARDRFWGGYSGYFQDPDGHLWDIAWNPELLPD
jgi:catechol 2,3-dioxygenase-like lactoylglutathione lyase family enzyme